MSDFVWTGSLDTNFSTPGNWDDETTGMNPSLVAPGSLDTVSINGTISGTGTVSTLEIGGTYIGTLTLDPTTTVDVVGGGIDNTYGFLTLDASAVVDATTYVEFGLYSSQGYIPAGLDMLPGSQMTLTGVSTGGSLPSALSLGGGGTIDAATLDGSGGTALLIGDLTVEGGSTVTFLSSTFESYPQPDPQGTTTITGPNTVWRDIGGAETLYGSEYGSSFAYVIVADHATMINDGAGTIFDFAEAIVTTGGTLTDATGLLLGDVGEVYVETGGELLVNSTVTLVGYTSLYVDSSSVIEVGGGTDPVSGYVNIDSDGTLLGLGSGITTGPVIDNGLIDARTGLLSFQDGVSGTGVVAIEAAALLEFGGTSGNSANVTFEGDGTLRLDVPSAFTGTIETLPTGSTIDVVGNARAEAHIVGNVLEVIGSSGTDHFALGEDYAGIGLRVQADGGTGSQAGTDVIVACFAAGTRIATADGERPIETLRAGDLVRTASGALRPAKWIGHRRLDLAVHPAPGEVRPVHIPTGAFGPRQPHRDLRLSPEHAVFVDGFLVPARYLIGCAGIAPDAAASEVTYYHIELDAHDVLLAEGLPCESWLDTGNRAMFANAATAALHFEERGSGEPCLAEAAWADSAFAPLVTDGPHLASVRRRLGAPTPQEVVVDRCGRFQVLVPAGCGNVRLLSRTGRVASDKRVLGVALCAIAIDRVPAMVDDLRLVSGFHPSEGQCRWTGGDALILLGQCPYSRSLTFEVSSLAPETLAA